MSGGEGSPEPGLARNWRQFSLLVLVNAFVGAMVGQERSILPAVAEHDFHLAARTGILSFIAVFGVAKALTNYSAGRLSDRMGRKPVLVAGWLVAFPVPFLLMWARSWSAILLANALLGVSQGLTWSTTVIMKIDLAGPRRRGLAMGLNEAAGYVAVAAAALATGYVAARYGLRPWPFSLGVPFAAGGLALSALAVRETRGHAEHEAGSSAAFPAAEEDRVFVRTTLLDRDLSAVSQAGLVNNLNDGMAWGLFPVIFATAGLGLERVGLLAAVYPALWGLGQLVTGGLSDRVGRKWLIASGMWVQAAAIGAIAVSDRQEVFLAGSALLGAGTAMVYPTLLAVIGDVAHPSWRASAVGVYRLWRDLGYAAGALVSGLAADLLGARPAVGLVALLTLASGVVVALRLRETRRRDVEERPGVSDWRSYDLIADRYDPVAGARFRAVAEKMWTLLPAGAARVLDVGTGTGIVLQAAARAGRRMGVAVGCDRSCRMLARARENVPAAGVVGAEALALPFADGAFDVVTASFVLSHIRDHHRALREAHRVLQAHGTIAVSSWAPASDPYTAAWGQCLADVIGRDQVERAAAVLPCETELSEPGRLQAALVASGFAVTAAETVDFVLAPTVAEFIADRELTPGGRLGLALLGAEEWDRVKARARAVLEARFGTSLRYARRALIAVASKR